MAHPIRFAAAKASINYSSFKTRPHGLEKAITELQPELQAVKDDVEITFREGPAFWDGSGKASGQKTVYADLSYTHTFPDGQKSTGKAYTHQDPVIWTRKPKELLLNLLTFPLSGARIWPQSPQNFIKDVLKFFEEIKQAHIAFEPIRIAQDKALDDFMKSARDADEKPKQKDQ